MMLKRYLLVNKSYLRFNSTVGLVKPLVTNEVNIGELAKKNLGSSEDSNHVEQPINVKALYYAPLKNPIKHGDLIADIQLRAYETSNLDFYADFIQRVAFYLGIPITGPKPLPSRRERWTVIRSPFVHAKSKENFERSTHKRLIRVWDTNEELLEFFVAYISKYSMAGIGAKCNVYKREKITIDFDDLEPVQKKLHDLSNSEQENDIVNTKVIELLNSPEFAGKQ